MGKTKYIRYGGEEKSILDWYRGEPEAKLSYSWFRARVLRDGIDAALVWLRAGERHPKGRIPYAQQAEEAVTYANAWPLFRPKQNPTYGIRHLI